MVFGQDIKPNVELLFQKEDVDGLIIALTYDKNSRESENYKVRKAAAIALGNIGDKKALEPLIHALKDWNWMVRKEAAAALGKIDKFDAVLPIIWAIAKEDYRTKLEMNFFPSLTPNDIKPNEIKKNEIYQSINSRKQFFRNIINLFVKKLDLSKMDISKFKPLKTALKDNDEQVRTEVINTLIKISDEIAIDALIPILKDKKNDLRAFAVLNLGRIDDERVIDHLIRALDDSNNLVRYEAIKSLGNIGNLKAIAALVKALKTPDQTIRTEIVNTLDEINWMPNNVEEEVWYFISKKEWDKAVQLCVSNEFILNEILETPDRYLRRNVSNALDEIDFKFVDTEEQVWFFISKKDWDQCVKVGSGAVKPLIKCLSDPNFEIRRDAIMALGKIQDSNAIEPIVQEFYEDDDYQVRLEALKALSNFKNSPSEPFVKALKDSYSKIREYSIDILSQKNWELPIDQLTTTLTDPDKTFRKKTISLLVKIGDPNAIKVLSDTLKHDEDNNIRLECLKALATFNETPINIYVESTRYLPDDEYYNTKILEIIREVKKAIPNFIKGNILRFPPIWFASLGELAVLPLIEIIQSKDQYFKSYRSSDVIWSKSLGEFVVLPIEIKKSEYKAAAAYSLGLIGDTRAAESVINWIFKYYKKRSYDEEIISDAFVNLLGDYAELIVGITDIGLKEIPLSSSGTGARYEYSLIKSDSCLKRICNINSPISNNILHKVTKKNDITITTFYWGMGEGEEIDVMSFDYQRVLASNELISRGNPPYDPSAYLTGDWRIH